MYVALPFTINEKSIDFNYGKTFLLLFNEQGMLFPRSLVYIMEIVIPLKQLHKMERFECLAIVHAVAVRFNTMTAVLDGVQEVILAPLKLQNNIGYNNKYVIIFKNDLLYV